MLLGLIAVLSTLTHSCLGARLAQKARKYPVKRLQEPSWIETAALLNQPSGAKCGSHESIDNERLVAFEADEELLAKSSISQVGAKKKGNLSFLEASRVRVGRFESSSGWDENLNGARSCDVAEILDFWQSFNITKVPSDADVDWANDRLGTLIEKASTTSVLRNRDHQNCKPGSNVLWLYPRHDNTNAFGIDAYVCHRLRFWKSKACSVTVRRVASLQEASDVVAEFGAGSISHLVLGGHGSGTALTWGDAAVDREGAKLKTDHGPSKELLTFIAGKLAKNCTVFMDSCFAGTLHSVENLGHYTARVLSHAMSASLEGPSGVRVFATIHTLDNAELVFREEAEKIDIASVKGAQSWQCNGATCGPINAVLPKKGYWIRSHYKKKDQNKSSTTDVGFIIGELSHGVFEVQFQDLVKQNLTADFFTQLIEPGTQMEAFPEGFGINRQRVILRGMGIDASVAVVASKSNGEVLNIPTKHLRPFESHLEYSGVYGLEYPAKGDMVLTKLRRRKGNTGDIEMSSISYVGIVQTETREGATVALGTLGRKWCGNHTSDVKPRDVVAVVKPGDKVIVDLSLKHLVSKGIFQGGFVVTEKDDGAYTFPVGVKVKIGDHQQMLDLDHIVSARRDGTVDRDIIRKPLDFPKGCFCKALDKDSWQASGDDGHKCSSKFCCNPDKDAHEWCYIENKDECGAKTNYGYCIPFPDK